MRFANLVPTRCWHARRSLPRRRSTWFSTLSAARAGRGLIEALRPGGRYVTAGAIAGPIVELDLRTLYLRDLAFFGCTHQPAASVFTDLVRYIEGG